MNTKSISIEQSGAFVDVFQREPTGSGPLDGLSFAVKDLIDVAGRRTGCGNPRWRDTHSPAVAHAVCVDQLLEAGARCVGKVLTDQLAFSLIGDNYFYGTPLNPRAPERVPGGSSSGSASAVACGLADFALGSDTGGSVRVPASNCGIFGLRPSHDIISVAGVMPFAPTFDTVGILATKVDVLCRAAGVLLACDIPAAPLVGNIYLVQEAFALADPNVQQALAETVGRLRGKFGDRVREVSLRAIDGETQAAGLEKWYEAYRIIQWAEVWNSLGAWITEAQPDFGPVIAASFELTRNLDRRLVPAMIHRREAYCRRLAAFLGPGDLLCIPTAPTPAPFKSNVPRRDQATGDYYPRALSLTSLAGVGRLPQVSLPWAECEGAPIGLSLLAGHWQDGFLLGVVQVMNA